ncbi:MAG: hypothetical protein MZV63_20460 [Marinilabiliales bacterium]|nr:hypothetical protein [Marinilabiliales bacterium]
MLALSEAGNFPAAIKTTAEWFPKKDRAFAQPASSTQELQRRSPPCPSHHPM